MTNTKKTKEPYNGSKAHGINLDKMAEKALHRLDLRFNYLKEQVKTAGQVISDSESDEDKKKSAYADVLKNQKELDEILEIKSRIMAMKPVLKSDVVIDYSDFDPSIIDQYEF